MSAEHIALVLEASDLSSAEKAVLLAMCDSSGTDGRVLAGEKRLSLQSGLSPVELCAWMAHLEARNLLVRGSFRSEPNAVWVNVPLLRDMRSAFFDREDDEAPSEENPFDGQ